MVQDGINHLNASAEYFPDLHELRADILLNHLDVEYFSGFIPEELDEPRGSISGEIHVRGSADDPQINGYVQLTDAGFRVIRYGTNLRIGTEGTATIQGSVHLSTNPEDARIEMRIQSRGIQLLNTTEQDSPEIYGTLFVDSDLHISGVLLRPSVSGSLGITGRSSFTVLLPQRGSDVGIGEGIVRFHDPESLGRDEQRVPFLTGVEITTSIKINLRKLFL